MINSRYKFSGFYCTVFFLTPPPSFAPREASPLCLVGSCWQAETHELESGCNYLISIYLCIYLSRVSCNGRRAVSECEIVLSLSLPFSLSISHSRPNLGVINSPWPPGTQICNNKFSGNKVQNKLCKLQNCGVSLLRS